MSPMSASMVKTTCSRDCYDACGISVLVQDGAVRKVMGDRDHHVSRGALCGKCALGYNGPFIERDKRLASPLRRSGPKGSGQFETVSWDEAIGEIADRMKTILEQAAPTTVLHTHYTGTVAMIAGWFPIRFFNQMGATEVDPDTVCNKAGHVALADMFGTSLTGFDPEQLLNATALMIWGANPSHSAPHMHRDWVRSSKARVIAIDPIAHETARQADLHLQLRPGTDAALAFGLLHVIKKAGRFDQSFIDRHVLGFERLQSDIDEATAEITEQRTGVPAALIEEAALQFSEGPSLLWLGQGMQRQPRGGNAFRAAVLLSVVTGHLGRLGAGFCYMNGPETRGVDYSFLMAPDLRNDGGASISHIDLADYLENAEKSRALFTWNNNILASSPAQSRLRKAIAREDLFTVVTDLFMTDTAMFADYILAAASFLEFDDLIFPYFHNTMSAQVKAAEPVGQALPNQEIFRRLARAMGYNAKELFESDESMLSRLIAQTSFKGSFEDLKAVGTVALCEKPLVQFEALHFNTPSGRIEVYSQRMEDLGQPPVPVPHADPVPIGDNLRVLSPASAWLMNSIYGNAEAVRKRMGDPTVYLSEGDATRRGLAEGDPVVLENAAGSLRLKVQISPIVPNGVALVYKGSWPRYTDDAANVNVLNPGLRSDIAESTAVHGVEASLVRS
jgi:anaerobic selenocysteine-containing dehydrogenase